MSDKLLIFSFLLVIGSVQATPQPVAKMATINRVNSIATQLLKIANHRVAKGGESDRQTLYKKIEQLLRSERDPDVLARVALISNIYLYPGSAGDEAVDDVFDAAWEACIRRIEQIGGQSAINALELVKWNMRLDGAYSLIWKESMGRLAARQPDGAASRPQ
jgi:hypothetical protein